MSHKPGRRLPLLSARPAVTTATLKRAVYQSRCLVNRGTMGVNSLPKTVTRQRRGCNLNPGHTAPESSTLTTPLPSRLTGAYSLNAHVSKKPAGHFTAGSRHIIAPVRGPPVDRVPPSSVYRPMPGRAIRDDDLISDFVCGRQRYSNLRISANPLPLPHCLCQFRPSIN